MSGEQPDWLSHVNRGNLELSRKRYAAAKKHYEHAVKREPKNPTPYEHLGNLYYFMGRLEPSMKYLFRAFELGSTNPLVLFNLGRMFFLGQELLDRGSYFLDRVLTLSPRSEAFVGTYLGVLFYLKGRADESAELLLRLRAATPLREPLEFFLGCAKYDMEHYDVSVKHFEDALSLKPRDEETLLMLGNAHFRQKNYDKAYACFKKILAANSTYKPAWHNAGIALQFLGKPGEAAGHFKKNLNIKKPIQQWKKGTLEEPGLERHLWQHVEGLLLEGTSLRGTAPLCFE